MFEHRREGLVPVHDHLDRIDRAVEFAEVALHAVFGIGDNRALCLAVPTEYVDEAGLVADAATIAGGQIDLDLVQSVDTSRYRKSVAYN
jgi:hypothetical protein